MIAHVKSLEDYDRVYCSELPMLLYATKIRSNFSMREAAERVVAPVLLQGPPEPGSTDSDRMRESGYSGSDSAHNRHFNAHS